MTTTNKPTGQHHLPKTYLRRFSIDPNDRNLKSMVYCFWTNQYETKTEPTSIDSKKFKENDFYTINHDTEPYAFENYFRVEIEPLYNKIMVEVESELNLSFECRQFLILWLYNNKCRNKANRANLERLTNFMIEVPYSMQYGKEKFEPLKEEAKKYATAKAKEIQLDSLIKEDLVMEFDKGMGTKHWIILKSKSGKQFLTNDNPGFSVNMEMGVADINSLNSFYATNAKASNYFILSPKYCLLISPFWQGTPMETSIHNQEIEFKVTNDKHIDFINYCTKVTRTTFLISNDKNLIDKHTKQK